MRVPPMGGAQPLIIIDLLIAVQLLTLPCGLKLQSLCPDEVIFGQFQTNILKEWGGRVGVCIGKNQCLGSKTSSGHLWTYYLDKNLLH